MSVLLEERLYYYAMIPGGCALIFTLFEFVFGEMIVEKSYPSETRKIMDAVDKMPEEVSNGLLNCLKTVIEDLRGCDKTLVLATIHLKVNVTISKEDRIQVFGLLQIFPYFQIGMLHQEFVSSKEKSGRILHGYKGIIGRCMRTENIESVNFATVDEYNFRMVNEFGFSKDEIEKHTFSARSYFAAPFKSNSEVIGIIYLFTKEPQVFPKAVDKAKFISTANHIVDILQVGKIIKTKANTGP
ncbi:hypothetical protein F9K33_10795 [bacterium]|nr:MAG: hypothetical protein F9K33_10795 [bacterium]